IVILFTDDQRFDTIQALNNPVIQTPNIDALVSEGCTFTRAHIPGGTSGAICMPSRAMLHTGRTLFHLDDCGQSIPDEHRMLGEHLQEHGYQTFGTGKWHNGTAAYARSFNHGAEIFFGGMDDHWNVPVHNYDPSGKYESRLPICPDASNSNDVINRNGDHLTAGKHSSELFAEAAAEFITGYESEDPFFVYVSFMAPHDPRVMPADFLNLYDAETIELPANFLGAHPFENGALHCRDEELEAFPRMPDKIKTHIAEYYAMITHLDDEIGKVISALKESGQYENTIIVFAGDNGLALGQHGLMGKQSMYEHSIRVPLIFSGPGIKQGQSDSYCYLLDIYATLCELVGIETPDTVDGKSLINAINSDASIRDDLYFAYVNSQRAVKDQRYKLIEYVCEGKNNMSQLFDLENDPWEMENLIDHPEHQERVKKLRERLYDYVNEWDEQKHPYGTEFWEAMT
ncbi:MAG: sulfatase-like hydrolase/transferase, partial [Lentisphaeria bacterium]|nr:sulfatase-like hydrolase/transferase [Lentisphaeria bacterium]